MLSSVIYARAMSDKQRQLVNRPTSRRDVYGPVSKKTDLIDIPQFQPAVLGEAFVVLDEVIDFHSIILSSGAIIWTIYP